MFASVSLKWISQSLTAWASNLFVFEQFFVSAVVSVATAASVVVVVVVVVVVTVFVVVSAAAAGAGRGRAAGWGAELPRPPARAPDSLHFASCRGFKN